MAVNRQLNVYQQIYNFKVLLAIFAQSYIPFPTNYSQWNQVETWHDGGSTGTINAFNYLYLIYGDTVINNINYQKVFQILFDVKEYVGGLIEDSNKNIFFLSSKCKLSFSTISQ